VIAISEGPRTLSAKKLEVPVKKIPLGQPPEKSVNSDSTADPASIDWFIAFVRGRAAQGDRKRALTANSARNKTRAGPDPAGRLTRLRCTYNSAAAKFSSRPCFLSWRASRLFFP
jgi:hypothetical protein